MQPSYFKSDSLLARSCLDHIVESAPVDSSGVDDKPGLLLNHRIVECVMVGGNQDAFIAWQALGGDRNADFVEMICPHLGENRDIRSLSSTFGAIFYQLVHQE